MNPALKEVSSTIRTYMDFPKKNIVFRDILPIFGKPELLRKLIDILADKVRSTVPDLSAVVGIEARGFLIGPPLALALNVAFVPLRKPGKLPGNVKGLEYVLEYGKDKLEVQTEALASGGKVVIVDDLLATGGSMKAACDLVTALGTTVALCMVIVELDGLDGRKRLLAPFYSVLQLSAFNP